MKMKRNNEIMKKYAFCRHLITSIPIPTASGLDCHRLPRGLHTTSLPPPRALVNASRLPQQLPALNSGGLRVVQLTTTRSHLP